LAAVNIKNNFVALATAVGLMLSVSVKAELVSTAGGLGVYDTVNNVTWTSDGNLFATQAASYSGGSSAFVAAVIAASGGVIYDTPNIYDTVPNSGNYSLLESDFITSGPYTGTVSWWGAQAWVNYLNAISYAGTSTWTLPTSVDRDSSYGYPPSQSTSQLAQLFYGGLGEVVNSPITSTHNSSYALFTNLQSYVYWSGTEYSAIPDNAWYLNTVFGDQSFTNKRGKFSEGGNGYALAVSLGQISAVPVPGAALLLGSGLIGLLGLRRKGRQS